MKSQIGDLIFQKVHFPSSSAVANVITVCGSKQADMVTKRHSVQIHRYYYLHHLTSTMSCMIM